MPKTKVINLFGGPGCGKSTTATGVFSLLKIHGVNCEYVSEYAKDRAWEGTLEITHNPFYITAKQHHRQFRLKDKVDVIVTDSPILIAMAYTDWKSHADMCRYLFSTFDNDNYVIKRVKKYNPSGRVQNAKEARAKDDRIIDLLQDDNINFKMVNGDVKGINTITSNILKELGIKQKYQIK